MALRLCWWDSKNFGDALNPYVFKALGHKVRYAQSDTADVIAIGSYLERLLVGALFAHPESQDPISVWGSGFQFEPGKHPWFREIHVPEKFIRPLKIKALRGHLSRARAEKITGTDLRGIALGDPGLLIGKIFDTSEIVKKFRLGVVAHFADKESDAFDKILRAIPNSVRIDIEAPVVDIVKNIASCEALVSSAMHPLIVADSLRVPNRWINVSDDKVSKYKFDDYYSVFGIKPDFFDLKERDFGEGDLERLHLEYPITDSSVQRIQDGLMGACPVSNALCALTMTDLVYLRFREMRDRENIAQKTFRTLERFVRRYGNAVQRRLWGA